MTSIRKMLQNGTAIINGTWIKPGGILGDLEICTRGVTDEYLDLVNKLQGEAAAKNMGVIPNEAAVNLQITAWVQACFLDVRGLTHDEPTAANPNPAPVTKDEFIAILRTMDGRPLWTACRAACAAVASQARAIEDEVVGNSDAHSPTV